MGAPGTIIARDRHPSDPEPGPSCAPAGPARTGGGLVAGLRVPALDGLRGVAVAAVLLFHGGFAWAGGGFLGVSTFFTLSGFLITTLLVAEHRDTGAIAGRAFVARRARRLLPAALAGFLVVVVFGVAVATADQQRALFGDLLAALTYVLNWRFIVSGQSYAQLFVQPSPVQHFWSLAIEGQFYLVFPLVAVVALGRRRTSIGRLAVAVGALMAVSLGLTLFAGFSHDRIYYGTDARAFELLAGAALALVLARRRPAGTPSPQPSSGLPWARVAIGIGGAIALLLCVVIWGRATLTTASLYHGGLAAYSLLSVMIVAAVVVTPRSAVARLLAWSPLRAIGVVSYGLYIFHWPVFLWLTPARTHLSLGPDFGLRVAVTAALAMASYRWLEGPARAAWGRRAFVRAAALASVVVLVASFAITAEAGPAPYDFAAAQRTVANAHRPAAGDQAGRPTVGWFGDSTGLVLAEGAVYDTGKPIAVANGGGLAQLGCSVGPGGSRKLTSGQVVAVTGACNHQVVDYGAFVQRVKPDLAVVLFGPNDLYDRQVPGVCRSWCHIGDPGYDTWLEQQMLDLVDAMSARGATVVWLTTPPLRGLDGRWQRFNQMIEALPAQRPGHVVVLDLAGHLVASGRDGVDRPDGVHLTKSAAVVVGQGWLDGRLVDIWHQAH